MTLDEAVRTRRSVRRYTGKPLTDGQVRHLMEAAMATPSACDCRPWEFVVVRDREQLARIAACGKYTGMAAQAGAVIVICALPGRQEICPGFFPQDCGAAIENILLQSLELGYGSCWCGIYPNAERVQMFRDKFGIASTPIALVVIGKADETPACRGHYDESRVRIL